MTDHADQLVGHAMVDQLALADNPNDEVAVAGILRRLFVPPAVSMQSAAEDYVTVLNDNGYCTVSALQKLELLDLISCGIPRWHAPGLLRAIRAPLVQPPKRTVETPKRNPNMSPAWSRTHPTPRSCCPVFDISAAQGDTKRSSGYARQYDIGTDGVEDPCWMYCLFP